MNGREHDKRSGVGKERGVGVGAEAFAQNLPLLWIIIGRPRRWFLNSKVLRLEYFVLLCSLPYRRIGDGGQRVARR